MKSIVKAILLLCILVSISSTNMRTKGIKSLIHKIGNKIIKVVRTVVNVAIAAIASAIILAFIGPFSIYNGLVDVFIFDMDRLSKGPTGSFGGILLSLPLLPLRILENVIDGLISFLQNIYSISKPIFEKKKGGDELYENFINDTSKAATQKVGEIQAIINQKKGETN